jgi:hypothetical protein
MGMSHMLVYSKEKETFIVSLSTFQIIPKKKRKFPSQIFCRLVFVEQMALHQLCHKNEFTKIPLRFYKITKHFEFG